MKRLAISLSIIVLLAMFFPAFSILAQPTHTPHENPATARNSPDPIALLLSYSHVFDLTALSQYQDALALLSELEGVNILDEARYIASRYNALSQQLVPTLENLEFLLDEASTLLSRNQISDAREKLDAAAATNDDARFLLEAIEAATNTLSDRLGVSAAPAVSQVRLAYKSLDLSLGGAGEFRNELDLLQQSLVERHQTQMIELTPVELSLSITPASVFIGDSITASGRLTGSDRPLAKRELTLLLDNEPLVTTTDFDGAYTARITIPYKYVDTMTLKAVYVPSGDDIDTYLASQSPPVAVNTMFYPTLLEVSAPGTAHPGLPATISGQISATDGSIDRTIKVLLDDTQLAEETVRGQFSLEITPPPQTSIGKHSLTVVAAPQQRYSGAVKSLTINISRLPIQTDIKTPLIVIPKTVQVSGRVYHNLSPIPDASISLTFKDSTTTAKTSADGSFTTSIEVPLDLSLVGPQPLTITIAPVEPWYASLQIKRRVFTINSSNLGLLLVAFLSLGLLIYNRVRTRLAAPREGKVIPPPPAQELPAVAPPARPKYRFTGIKGRILSAYLNGLGAVEKSTGTPMAAGNTLREFLKNAALRLPTAIKPFAELTTIAEVALYSTHKLDETMATKAEQLATTIKEELYNGTS